MSSVKIPGIPSEPRDLEDYVAALFQCAGFFVERNVRETDVLELDVVATSFDQLIPSRVVIEVKSGRWHFRDIFTVLGQMRYLDIDRGAFCVRELEDRDAADIQQRIEPHNIAFIHFGDFSGAISCFEAAGFPKVADPALIELWRLSYLAERKLISYLTNLIKTAPELEGPRQALIYYNLVNHQIFFVKDVRERLAVLYDAYKTHPRLSLAIAREKDGHPYDPYAYGASMALSEAIFQGKHPRIQASLYIEHRARLAILKEAIHYICLNQAGLLTTTAKGIDWNQVLFNTLPDTFHGGLDLLQQHPFFRRYALFWQVFLWGLGGFYLEDRKEAEFRWLADHTGIPIDDILSVLSLFDVLFRQPGGESWIARPGPTQCNVVKMVPMPFRGLGAYQRIRIHGLTNSYRELGYNDFTGRDLGSWTLSAIHFLKSWFA